MNKGETGKTVQQNLTENDIFASLDAAVSSYSTKDFEEIAKKTISKTRSPRKVKKAVENTSIETPIGVVKAVSSTKIKKSRAKTLEIEKTLDMVITQPEVIEEPISHIVEPVEAEEAVVKKPKKAKKSHVKQSKKALKTKHIKKARRGLFSRLNVVSPVVRGVKNASSTYRTQLMTMCLALVMVSFVGFSTYIAYAYVANVNGDMVQKVGAHVILPGGETPKVYIIQSEKSEIFQNPLFKGIKVGDNVLSYSKAGKVIIYRSSEDKLVNIVNTSE